MSKYHVDCNNKTPFCLYSPKRELITIISRRRKFKTKCFETESRPLAEPMPLSSSSKAPKSMPCAAYLARPLELAANLMPLTPKFGLSSRESRNRLLASSWKKLSCFPPPPNSEKGKYDDQLDGNPIGCCCRCCRVV